MGTTPLPQNSICCQAKDFRDARPKSALVSALRSSADGRCLLPISLGCQQPFHTPSTGGVVDALDVRTASNNTKPPPGMELVSLAVSGDRKERVNLMFFGDGCESPITSELMKILPMSWTDSSQMRKS